LLVSIVQDAGAAFIRFPLIDSGFVNVKFLEVPLVGENVKLTQVLVASVNVVLSVKVRVDPVNVIVPAV
jgi:hypothetical protein